MTESSSNDSEKSKNTDSPVDIFRYPKMRMVAIEIFFVFFVISMVYMGISYNAAELPGNIWLINAINGILDGVSQFAGMAALVRFGRRSILAITLVITGISYVGMSVGIDQKSRVSSKNKVLNHDSDRLRYLTNQKYFYGTVKIRMIQDPYAK